MKLSIGAQKYKNSPYPVPGIRISRIWPILPILCLPMLASANGILDKRISVQFTDVRLERALEVIGKQAGCQFVYSATLFDVQRKVSGHFYRKSVREVLFGLLQEELAEVQEKGTSLLLIPANGSILGRIHSSTNEPIPYASVILDSLKRGVVTDEDGAFELKVPRPGLWALRVSTLGYEELQTTVKVGAGEKLQLNLVLNEKAITIDEVVVRGNRRRTTSTATRTPTAIKDLPMPVMLIEGGQLEMMGSRRLNEVLQEQTGLALTTDPSGASSALGLQMQGFDASYTMIMIDGQPLIGRNAMGILDLSRITVANIDRIEIVKGTSSAMYGSDALAGVVNIITKGQPSSVAQGVASLRYGTYNTMDATFDGGIPLLSNRTTAAISANYYSTDGFDADATTPGNTLPPFTSYSLQGKVDHRLGKRDLLSTSLRYARRDQTNRYDLDLLGSREDTNVERDLILTALMRNTFRDSTELTSQYYYTRYRAITTNMDLMDDQIINENDFAQSFHRLESFANHPLSKRVMFTGGIGGNSEILDASRFGETRLMNTGFAYTQLDYTPNDKLGVLAGLRYDVHSIYGWQLSPRLGLRYHFSDKLTIKGSAGTGFKAPSFQELYLSFTNPTAGYTILGAEVFDEETARLQGEGQISGLFPIAEQIGELEAERSFSLNAGFVFSPNTSLSFEVNAFSNDIRNMIFEELVGIKTNGSQLFSYRNIEEAFTRGLETNVQWQVTDGMQLSIGHQLLYAKDKGVIDAIKAGEKEIRTPEGQRSIAEPSDYFNLSNRSRHMLNLKLFYEHDPWQMRGSLRANYRGKYGLGDRNYPNNFIDPYDLFVEGYTLLNATVEKQFMDRKLSVQLICDNLTGHTDPLVPNLLGRQFMLSLSWRIQGRKNPKRS